MNKSPALLMEEAGVRSLGWFVLRIAGREQRLLRQKLVLSRAVEPEIFVVIVHQVLAEAKGGGIGDHVFGPFEV